MRALITGAGGFVGNNLCNLLKQKEYKIFGLNRTPSYADVTTFRVDIREKEGIIKAVTKSRPDFIFHLSALSSTKQCMENPALAHDINVNGTKNLLSACIELNINPKILIASSAHVYGIPKYLPIDELHPTNPINEYGKSKLEQEQVALKFFEEHELGILIARSFNHIGQNQPTGFVCSDFAKQIAEIEKGVKEPLIRVGNLEVERDFTDVRDIVKAYLSVVEKCEPGNIYNVCSGQSRKIQKILGGLLRLSKTKIKIKKDKSKFRPNDIPVLRGDNSKLASIAGWKPEISMDQTLKDILDYWRGQLN